MAETYSAMGPRVNIPPGRMAGNSLLLPTKRVKDGYGTIKASEAAVRAYMKWREDMNRPFKNPYEARAALNRGDNQYRAYLKDQKIRMKAWEKEQADLAKEARKNARTDAREQRKYADANKKELKKRVVAIKAAWDKFEGNPPEGYGETMKPAEATRAAIKRALDEKKMMDEVAGETAMRARSVAPGRAAAVEVRDAPGEAGTAAYGKNPRSGWGKITIDENREGAKYGKGAEVWVDPQGTMVRRTPLGDSGKYKVDRKVQGSDWEHKGVMIGDDQNSFIRTAKGVEDYSGDAGIPEVPIKPKPITRTEQYDSPEDMQTNVPRGLEPQPASAPLEVDPSRDPYDQYPTEQPGLAPTARPGPVLEERSDMPMDKEAFFSRQPMLPPGGIQALDDTPAVQGLSEIPMAPRGNAWDDAKTATGMNREEIMWEFINSGMSVENAANEVARLTEGGFGTDFEAPSGDWY